MKRIKSAPADIALMLNNKKQTLIKDSKSTSKLSIPFLYNKNVDDKNNHDKNNIILLEKDVTSNYSNLKTSKKYLKNLIDILSDLLYSYNSSNNLPIEESNIEISLLLYLGNNLFKKDILKEMYNFIVQAIIKYFVILFIHTYILHDKINSVIYLLSEINK